MRTVFTLNGYFQQANNTQNIAPEQHTRTEPHDTRKTAPQYTRHTSTGVLFHNCPALPLHSCTWCFFRNKWRSSHAAARVRSVCLTKQVQTGTSLRHRVAFNVIPGLIRSTMSLKVRDLARLFTLHADGTLQRRSLCFNLLRPTRFNIKKFYVVPTLRLCVLYGAQNKQQLLPYKTL
jgi:hypothetical protein